MSAQKGSLPVYATNNFLTHYQAKWTQWGLRHARIFGAWGGAFFLAAMFFGQPRKYFQTFFSYVPPPIGPYFKKQYNPREPYLKPVLQ